MLEIKIYLYNGNLIETGETASASDFINEAEADPTPANNEGKVPKLENTGRIDEKFSTTVTPKLVTFTSSGTYTKPTGLKKIIVELWGAGGGDGVYTLLADDGEFMASHYCSDAGYAQKDLHDTREERKTKWKERFGEYKVLWLGDDDMKLDTLLERNKEWAKKDEEAQRKIEENGTSIKIELND